MKNDQGILLELKDRKKVHFDVLTDAEKRAINSKEIIEDDYFIIISHHTTEIDERIDALCPLNFYVTEDLKLVAYCEDGAELCETLPPDTLLTFNAY